MSKRSSQATARREEKAAHSLRLNCSADHAERTLFTNFREYQDFYTPGGRKLTAKRPQS